MKPPLPPNEEERLEALRRYDILDTLPERDFDDFTRLASEICQTPIALISLIDDSRQWFKSRVGLEFNETPREFAFCAYALLKPQEMLIIRETLDDERFRDHPAVKDQPWVRFYAGAPLTTDDGLPLGTLCVIDRKPRDLSEEQRSALQALSRQVMRLMELRRRSRLLFEATEELAKARDAALELSRMKSQFLANMSHEIRTPMNGVLGMTNLLLQSDLSQEQVEYVRILESSAESLLGVINDILDFSRIEAGKLSIIPVPFQPSEMVEQVADLFAGNAYAKKVELVVWTDRNAFAHRFGDAHRVRQILNNLVGNAVKFTNEGQIELCVEAKPDGLLFTVRDTGIGIPEGKLDQIFESFTQIEGGNARPQGGSGLGLTISSNLARLMGGDLAVESVHGKGSVFRLQLPTPLASDLPEQPPPAVFPALRVAVMTHPGPMRDASLALLEVLGFEPVVLTTREELTAWSTGTSKKVLLMTAAHSEIEVADRLAQEGALSVLWLVRPGVSLKGRAGSAITKPVTYRKLSAGFARLLGSAQTTKRQPEGTPTPLLNRRILVVEDNLVNQRVALALLERMGAVVVIASDGEDALQAVLRQNFDAILMDLQMPRMDGFQATRLLRKREVESNHPRVPIVALTANAVGLETEACLAAGMDQCLTKPLAPMELMRVFEQLLRPR
jgi:signal transduction histidine kinase/CheY-like chemotaxis protein